MSEEKNAEVTTSMLSNRKKPEGNKTPQYLATIAVTLSTFAFGTELAWTSPALPYLQSANSTLPVTPEEGSWIGSLLAIGAIIGALPAGYISNLFGRKPFGLSLSVIFILSWLLIYFAKSSGYICVGRLIAGIATGAASVVCPMYIGEIAEASVRGSLGGYVQLMITGGILYVYLLGAFLSYDQLNIGCVLIPIAFLIAFINTPESPVYLLMKNKRSEAEKSLRKLRGASYDIHSELNATENELSKSSAQNISMFQLFSKKANIKAVICALGLMFFQQFCGINAVIFYSLTIFHDAGSTLDPKVAVIIVGVVQVAVTLIASLIVDKAGRRILLLISFCVMSICLGILGYFFHMKEQGQDVSNIGLLPLVSVVLFIIAFSLGAGPIPWLMAGELFTTEIKGIASGIAVALNWISVFIVTKTFQTLNSAFGQSFSFGYFSVICIIAFVFVFFVIPETKGKSLEEIQIMLSGKRNKRSNQNNLV